MQEQEATMAELKSTVAQQTEIRTLITDLKEQASQIQKASAQLEVTKTAPRTVVNNH